MMSDIPINLFKLFDKYFLGGYHHRKVAEEVRLWRLREPVKPGPNAPEREQRFYWRMYWRWVTGD